MQLNTYTQSKDAQRQNTYVLQEIPTHLGITLIKSTRL